MTERGYRFNAVMIIILFICIIPSIIFLALMNDCISDILIIPLAVTTVISFIIQFIACRRHLRVMMLGRLSLIKLTDAEVMILYLKKIKKDVFDERISKEIMRRNIEPEVNAEIYEPVRGLDFYNNELLLGDNHILFLSLTAIRRDYIIRKDEIKSILKDIKYDPNSRKQRECLNISFKKEGKDRSVFIVTAYPDKWVDKMHSKQLRTSN